MSQNLRFRPGSRASVSGWGWRPSLSAAGKEKGKLVLSFQNQAELDKILQHFELQ